MTTTQMIRGFEEGAVKFENVHSMGVPLSGDKDVSLRISIFARITSMHLDKLLSWDEMRDHAATTVRPKDTARIAESQFYTEEKHDLFARVQILELSETGEYTPVEVLQTENVGSGCFQLHQGLQRRVVVSMSHSSGEALPLVEAGALKMGHVTLLDHNGKEPDQTTPMTAISLRLVSEPVIKINANGTTSTTLIGQWDSSLHNSLFLDRVTADKYKVKMSVTWQASTDRFEQPVKFSMDVYAQVLSRSFVRQSSMFASLWQTVRIVHSSSAIFTLTLQPSPIKKVSDLWRANTSHDYIKGEEILTNWTPRGVSLVHDFFNARRRKRRLADLESARAHLSIAAMTTPVSLPNNGHVVESLDQGDLAEGASKYSEHQQQLLRKFLDAWTITRDPITTLLHKANTAPPDDDSTTTSDFERPRLMANVTNVLKSSTLIKGGYLLVPSLDNTRWVRRFVELRQPYLHIYSVPDGEEVGAICLRNSRVDLKPQVAGLLDTIDSGRSTPNGNSATKTPSKTAADGRKKCIFAIYGTDNSWMFCARSEKDKVEWIHGIDRAYFESDEGRRSIGKDAEFELAEHER